MVNIKTISTILFNVIKKKITKYITYIFPIITKQTSYSQLSNFSRIVIYNVRACVYEDCVHHVLYVAELQNVTHFTSFNTVLAISIIIIFATNIMILNVHTS